MTRRLVSLLFCGLVTWSWLDASAAAQSQSNGFQPLRGQKILLKGDSIARGYAFGNYTDPSPLRAIPGMGAILLRENLSPPPAFESVPNIWQGLRPDGTPITVDTLAAELNGNIKQGGVATGDWLVYEDAGEVDQGIHPAPSPWKKDIYLNYRQSLRDMVHAIEDVVDRSHIVFMTMFDYKPSPRCRWDAPLDMAGRTGNDAIRDEAAELGIRVIDMNRIMDAANDYLREKGWGRPVGPDGIHPNVYGNFVMTLAILGELGAPIANWKLDPLYGHFLHPNTGGDVAAVWGFTRDPDDRQRIEILNDLRRIVVREMAKSPAAVSQNPYAQNAITPSATCGVPQIVRHGRLLGRVARQPEGTSRPVIYEVGKFFQLDRQHGLLVASLREEGGHDFEVGNDGFVFRNLHELVPETAIPINRLDPHYHLKSNGAPAIQGRFPVSGGFVPLEAKLPDGKPHPAAGTGFLFSRTLTFLPDRTQGHPQAGKDDRDIEVMQLRWDGSSLRVTGRDFVKQLAGIDVGRVGLSNGIADGAGVLCPFAADDGSYVVVVRFEFDGHAWKGVQAGRPFHQAAAPHKSSPNRVYRWLETEASILRDGSRFLVYTRGYDVKGRVYTSTDGLNYTLLFDHYNYNAPQTLNQGLDGSIFLITNRGPGLLRNPLLAFPLRGQNFREPWVIHDERRVRAYDPQARETPFVDHGVGANLFLEGRWRYFVAYRVTGLHETDGEGAPQGPHTGLYCDELIYDHVVRPTFGF
jgi:hypothetical protein